MEKYFDSDRKEKQAESTERVLLKRSLVDKNKLDNAYSDFITLTNQNNRPQTSNFKKNKTTRSAVSLFRDIQELAPVTSGRDD